MLGAEERATLFVEGRDDQYLLINLLRHHGIDYGSQPWPEEFPEFRTPEQTPEAPGVHALLDYVPTAVRLGTGKSIGFVFDADSPLAARWASVRQRLQRVNVQVPDQCPPDGFIGKSPGYKSTVGVWLMPDNQHDGTLETFLHELIDEQDPLINHAESATDLAKQRGAKFPDSARLKAVIHTWLAWQEKPGLPYGTAMQARYFRPDSPVAARFVAWFKQLYGIS